MRGLFATATAVLQVAFYKKVRCSDDRIGMCSDPIYGQIELPQICVRIIETPEFQRLRKIKQLGATYEVFPDDVHTIYRHCLGVCHLAGTFGKHLQKQIDQELKNGTSDLSGEMKITNDDIICLQVAGLCHDIGHGPMSQAFESHFIRKLDPASKWTHEQGSLMMFDYLVNKYNLPIKPKDKVFIKQLIHRDQKEKNETGRTKEKDFLYEIISNEESGNDVDKWDYFARHNYIYRNMGFEWNYHNCFIHRSRVHKVDGSWHISYLDKHLEDMYKMYTYRLDLHRGTCKHKSGQTLERMYMEALVEANEHYRITTSNGKKWKISDSIKDAEAFSLLTDHVFRDIRNSADDELKEARNIMKRIDMRNQYKLVSTASPKPNEETRIKLPHGCDQCNEEKSINQIVKSVLSEDKIKPEHKRAVKKIIDKLSGYLQQEESQILEEIVKCSNGKLKQEDLMVDISIFDYERQERNPVDKVYFYRESKIQPVFKLWTPPQEDLQLVCRDHRIRLFMKKGDEELQEEARKCFKIWCGKRNITRVN